MQLGYSTITWGGVVGNATGVTSVKDLYYRANGSMERAIADIGSVGYAGVEMFDGNLVDFADRPDDLRRLLDDAGVQLAAVYTGGNFVYDEILPDELSRVAHAARLAQTFGATSLAVGGGARRAAGTTDADYDRLAAALDRVDAIAADHGLSACYHPHLTTIVESPDELDRLMPATRIGFCPDTAHLAAGGGDPAQLIRRYADRVRHVHLKDLRTDPFAFLPLGEGSVDLPGVVRAVLDSGYDGWLLVELDDYDGDPRDAAAASKTYLDALLADAGNPTTGVLR